MQKPTLEVLEKVLTYTTARQKVISRNIANVNTEYYQRDIITFDEELEEVFKVPFKLTREQHIPLGDPKKEDFSIVKDPDYDPNSGLNNVVIDREMADMAETNILFKFASRKISGYFKTLQNVIKGGTA